MPAWGGRNTEMSRSETFDYSTVEYYEMSPRGQPLLRFVNTNFRKYRYLFKKIPLNKA
jgi:hypothetical protein